MGKIGLCIESEKSIWNKINIVLQENKNHPYISGWFFYASKKIENKE